MMHVAVSAIYLQLSVRLRNCLKGIPMSNDPIIDEVREARRRHAEQFNFDLDAIYEDIKRRELASGRTYLDPPPRLPTEQTKDAAYENPNFVLGRQYTRNEISARVGGSIQSYLPVKNGKVTCGCFNKEINPEAPDEVLFGAGDEMPQVESSAQLVFEQGQRGESIPIFVKRSSNNWEYIGDYRCTFISFDSHLVSDRRNKYPHRGQFAGILRFQPVNAQIPEAANS